MAISWFFLRKAVLFAEFQKRQRFGRNANTGKTNDIDCGKPTVRSQPTAAVGPRRLLAHDEDKRSTKFEKSLAKGSAYREHRPQRSASFRRPHPRSSSSTALTSPILIGRSFFSETAQSKGGTATQCSSRLGRLGTLRLN